MHEILLRAAAIADERRYTETTDEGRRIAARIAHELRTVAAEEVEE